MGMVKYIIGGLLVIGGTIFGIIWFISSGISGASVGVAIGGIIVFIVIVLAGKYMMKR
jgi:hypothetical protein